MQTFQSQCGFFIQYSSLSFILLTHLSSVGDFVNLQLTHDTVYITLSHAIVCLHHTPQTPTFSF